LAPRQLDDLLEIEAANLIEQGGNIRAMLQRLQATQISPAAKRGIADYLGRCPAPQRIRFLRVWPTKA
jgi:hypothetical protein